MRASGLQWDTPTQLINAGALMGYLLGLVENGFYFWEWSFRFPENFIEKSSNIWAVLRKAWGCLVWGFQHILSFLSVVTAVRLLLRVAACWSQGAISAIDPEETQSGLAGNLLTLDSPRDCLTAACVGMHWDSLFAHWECRLEHRTTWIILCY